MPSKTNPVITVDESLAAYTAIDLDRTILKSTALFYKYIIPALQSTYGYDSSVIQQVLDTEKASRGKAFDFVAYTNELAYTQQLPIISVEELAGAVIADQRDDSGQITDRFTEAVLVDGTIELIRVLSEQPREQWGILTSGGRLTQRLKLLIIEAILTEKLHLPLRAEIIGSERKAQMIMEEWYDDVHRVFKVPITAGEEHVVVRRVRLLDDKPINTMLPSSIEGKAQGKLVTHLVRAAESAEFSDGLTLQQVIQKIQQDGS